MQGALLATYYEDLCSGCQANKATAYRTGLTGPGGEGELESSNRTGAIRSDHYANRTGREGTNENLFAGQPPNVTTIHQLNRTSIGQFDKADYLAKGEILKSSNSTLNVTDIFDKDDPPMNNRNSSSSYLFYSTWQLFKYFLAKSGGSASAGSLSALNFTQQQQNQTQRRPSIQLEPDSPDCSSNNGSLPSLASNFIRPLTTSNQTADSSTATVAATVNFTGSPIELSTLSRSTENGTSSIRPASTQTETAAIRTQVNLSAGVPADSSPAIGLTADSPSEAAKANKCPGLEIDCSEFNVDKMLAVRLCCLNGSSLLSKGNGFSCRRFDRTECNKVLPIIKCCLRDLSEILEDYFSAKKDVKNER